MNQRGQGFIEAIFILPIFLFGFAFIFQIILYLSLEMAIDNTLEDFLFCKIESKMTCQEDLFQKTNLLPLKIDYFNYRSQNEGHHVDLYFTALNWFQIKKVRALNFSKNIYVENK